MTADNRELFKKALIEALYSKYEDEIKDSSDESAICSPVHYNKLRRLGIKVKEQRIGKISKKSFVAILVAAALLLVGCTAYVYRDKVRDFIETIYEKYIHVTYDSGKPNDSVRNVEKPYTLTYIPEGYELISESKTPIDVYYKWQDDSTNIITFRQIILDGTNFKLDAEQGDSEILYCGNYTIYFRKIEDSYHYIWNDGEYALTLTSYVELSHEEISKIIDGIKTD